MTDHQRMEIERKQAIVLARNDHFARMLDHVFNFFFSKRKTEFGASSHWLLTNIRVDL
jgi:hypothetical protein